MGELQIKALGTLVIVALLIGGLMFGSIFYKIAELHQHYTQIPHFHQYEPVPGDYLISSEKCAMWIYTDEGWIPDCKKPEGCMRLNHDGADQCRD